MVVSFAKEPGKQNGSGIRYDYRFNQKDAQRRWREQHPDYSKEYRKSHPEYCQRNRKMQRHRDGKRQALRLAKMDALAQRIAIIPVGYKEHNLSCKEGLDRQEQEVFDKSG